RQLIPSCPSLKQTDNAAATASNQAYRAGRVPLRSACKSPEFAVAHNLYLLRLLLSPPPKTIRDRRDLQSWRRANRPFALLAPASDTGPSSRRRQSAPADRVPPCLSSHPNTPGRETLHRSTAAS